MSVKPIDLQVNFSQINHVGKEQAFLKEGLLHQQALMEKESAMESLNADKKVAKTGKESDPNKIQDDQQSHPQKHDTPFFKKNSYDKKSCLKEEDDHTDDPFEDPDLGKILDLKG